MGRRAFTLIELIAVIVVLAILAGVALPRHFDKRQEALDAADSAAIAGINTALMNAFLHHQAVGATSEEWITTLDQISDVMETGQLPSGFRVNPFWVFDQRNNRYSLVPETNTSPAALRPVVPGPPTPPPGSGKGGG